MPKPMPKPVAEPMPGPMAEPMPGPMAKPVPDTDADGALLISMQARLDELQSALAKDKAVCRSADAKVLHEQNAALVAGISELEKRVYHYNKYANALSELATAQQNLIVRQRDTIFAFRARDDVKAKREGRTPAPFLYSKGEPTAAELLAIANSQLVLCCDSLRACKKKLVALNNKKDGEAEKEEKKGEGEGEELRDKHAAVQRQLDVVLSAFIVLTVHAQRQVPTIQEYGLPSI